MADDLEERLKSHAKAFEGLMSLIPANQYYVEDTSDQWQRKKQTKEQRREAKRAQLDPENRKSAQDVMNENERKRKRELEGAEADSASDVGVQEREKPLEGLKKPQHQKKKQKLESSTATRSDDVKNDEDQATKPTKADKRREKAERKREKKVKQKEKAEAKHARKKEADTHTSTEKATSFGDQIDASLEDDRDAPDAIEQLDVGGLISEHDEHAQSTTPPSIPESPESDASANPSPSSSSSIVPPTAADDDKPRKILKLPEADQEAVKARLRARIEAHRAARKADGINGKPARTRQELLEARRRKDQQRKEHKKELRAKSKEDEQRKAAEAELARLRGSGSPLTPDIFSPRGGEPNNFSFGRVAFDDGQQLDSSLSSLVDPKKRKGPQDPRSALEAAERKRARVNGFDPEKRANIEQKDMWLNAKKRAHGETVRDDTSLLKKTLKRKEKSKQKSEREWNDRIAGVQKGQEARQKKREGNLKKRKEEKGSKGKGGGKKAGGKAKARPGFEGSFRAKAK